MTRPEETDVDDKAAFAGADDAEPVEAEVVDDDAATGEVVNDGTAGGDGAEVPYDTSGDDGADDELARVRKELDERTEDLQRVSAEFANYRRRADRDRTVGAADAKAKVLVELLPVVDDLDRARQHGDLDEGPLKVFADKVTALLASQGVEEFGAEGDAFDPALHEAVQDESEGGEPVLGTVLRKGYRLGERTLRTAMVIVR